MRFIIFETGAEAAAVQTAMDVMLCSIFGDNYRCKFSDKYTLSRNINGIEINVQTKILRLGLIDPTDKFGEMLLSKYWVGSLIEGFNIRTVNGKKIAHITDATKVSAVIESKSRFSRKTGQLTSLKLYRDQLENDGGFALYESDCEIASFAIGTSGSIIRETGNLPLMNYTDSEMYGSRFFGAIVMLHKSNVNLNATSGTITEVAPGVQFFREENPSIIQNVIIPLHDMDDTLSSTQFCKKVCNDKRLLFLPYCNFVDATHNSGDGKKIYEIDEKYIHFTRANNASIKPKIQEAYTTYRNQGGKEFKFCFVCGCPLFGRIFIYGNLFAKNPNNTDLKLFGFGTCQNCGPDNKFIGSQAYDDVYTTVLNTTIEEAYEIYVLAKAVTSKKAAVICMLEKLHKDVNVPFTDLSTYTVKLGEIIVANSRNRLYDALNKPKNYDKFVIM